MAIDPLPKWHTCLIVQRFLLHRHSHKLPLKHPIWLLLYFNRSLGFQTQPVFYHMHHLQPNPPALLQEQHTPRKVYTMAAFMVSLICSTLISCCREVLWTMWCLITCYFKQDPDGGISPLSADDCELSSSIIDQVMAWPDQCRVPLISIVAGTLKRMDCMV